MTEPFGHISCRGGQELPGGAEVNTGGQEEGRKGISPMQAVPRHEDCSPRRGSPEFWAGTKADPTALHVSEIQ